MKGTHLGYAALGLLLLAPALARADAGSPMYESVGAKKFIQLPDGSKVTGLGTNAGQVAPGSALATEVARAVQQEQTLITGVAANKARLGQLLPSVMEFGAVCDGVTDDTAAIRTASSSGKTIRVPPGQVCAAPGLLQSQLVGRFVGGQIRTSDGKRGPSYGAVSSPPAQSTDPTSFTGWANADMSHPLSAEEYHIHGPATAGLPKTGYQYMQGIDPHYAYFDTDAGWNQSTSGNDGRTGQSYEQITMQHNGQGDLTVRTSEIFCNGIPKANGTNFLANPACAAENGDIIALQDGQFLQKEEFHIVDNGHQVAAVNRVAGFQRNNAGETLNETWEDTRADCRPVACDAWASVTGYWGIGLTFLGPASNTPAIIAAGPDERIYLNASNNDNNANPSKTVLGGDYLGFSSANQTLDLADNGGPALRLKNNPNPVNAVTVSGAPSGSAVGLSATGSDALIPMIIQDKGGAGVVVQSNGAFAAKFSGPPSTANYLGFSGAAAGGAPSVSAIGTDGVVPLLLQDKSGGGIIALSNGSLVAKLDAPQGATSYLEASPGVGSAFTLRVQSTSPTDLSLQPSSGAGVVLGGFAALPIYALPQLPAAGRAGRAAFCADCLKPGETATSGTGMLVFDDGHGRWISTAGTVAQD